MPQEYATRDSLKQSLRGPQYQVLVALHLLLKALKDKKRVRVMLEMANAGALDDVVIEYLDSNDNISERHYIQQKHANDSTEKLEKGDLHNKSGKCEVFKYFDDWFFFVSDKTDAGASPCYYFTNRDFDASTQTYLKKNGAVLKSGVYHFTDKSFTAGSDALYKKLIALVENHAVCCKQSLSDGASGQLRAQNPTYAKAKTYYEANKPALTGDTLKSKLKTFLKDHYRLAVNQASADELYDTVKEQVADYFQDIGDSEPIFNALLEEAWQWFRVLHKAEIWTGKTLEKKLESFKARFIALPIAFGKGSHSLQTIVSSKTPRIKRETLIKALDRLTKDPRNLKVLHGEKRTGKSTLVAQYLLEESTLKLGEFLYFDSLTNFLKQQAETDFSKIKTLKLIVIDGIDTASADLKSALQALLSKKKKVILVTSAEAAGFDTSAPLKIPKLSSNSMKKHLAALGITEHCITVGSKRIPLGELAKQKSGLRAQMRYPKGLCQLCELATPPTDMTETAAFTSRYVTQWPSGFEPIPLRGMQKISLYDFKDLLQPAFDERRMAFYRSPANLALIKSKNPAREGLKWLDIGADTLPPDSPKTTKEILADILRGNNKEDFKYGKLTLALNITEAIPPQRVSELLAIPNVIVFSNANEETKKFILVEQEGTPLFEYIDEDLTPLPSSKRSLARTLENPIATEFESQVDTMLVVAPAGSGKSTLLQQIYQKHATSSCLTWGNNYHHLVLVPLHTLANLQLKDLVSVAAHFLLPKPNETLLRNALQADLDNGRILFLLDGWDELSGTARKRLEKLLKAFKKYDELIITARPSDRKTLFFTPTVEYELLPFDKKQIKACFEAYFKNEEKPDIVKTFIKQAVDFILRPENSEALEVIGLPLQCYLVCEAWRPYFDATCAGKKVEMPWENTTILTRTGLYELFASSRLRRVFAERFTENAIDMSLTESEIYRRNTDLVTALQTAAYQHLFRGKALKFGNDWLAQDIRRSAIVTDEQGFIHKTYAECFAALYLVNLLRTNPTSAKGIILKYRYQPHYRLVFEFMAGMVSYGHTAIASAKQMLFPFWDALLQTPRDQLGQQEQVLLTGCCKQSDRTCLADIFDLPTIKKLLPEPEKATAEKIKLVAAKAPHQQAGGAAAIAPEDTAPTTFQAPTKTLYRELQVEINNLPIEQYSIEELKRAFAWLKEKHTRTSGDIVKKACMNQISFCSKRLMSKGQTTIDGNALWTEPATQDLNVFIACADANPAFLDNMQQYTESKEKKDPSLNIYFLCVLLKKEYIPPEIYFHAVTELNDDSPHAFSYLSELIAPTSEMFNNPNIKAAYQNTWAKKIYTFAKKAITTHAYKECLPNFMKELVRLETAPEVMEALLSTFLSKESDHSYWDCDAIKPCFSNLHPYFGEAYKQYIRQKTLGEMHWKSKLDELVPETLMPALSKENKEWVATLCLELDDQDRKKRKGKRGYYDADYTRYFNTIDFRTAVAFILKDLNTTRVQLLKEFLENNHCALTVSKTEIHIYHTEGHEAFEITDHQETLLAKLKKTATIQLLDQVEPATRPASPAFFSLGDTVPTREERAPTRTPSPPH